MRGRKPKPAVIKLLEGNPGKRPIPPEVEATGEPFMVELLEGKALEWWDRNIPQLVSMGVAFPQTMYQP